MSNILTDNMRFIKVDPTNKNSLELFSRFYNDIFVGAFTNEDECESLDSFFGYINEYGSNSLFVQILLVCMGENIVGGIIFDYYSDIKTLVIEFIVIDDMYRGNGIAIELINHVIAYLASEHGKVVEWIFIEIENPEYVKDNNFSYFSFWKKFNMKALDFTYIQPALSPDKCSVKTLMLCARNMQHDIDTIEIGTVKKLLYLYAHYAMKIADPQSDPSIAAMYLELDNKDANVLKLKNLER